MKFNKESVMNFLDFKSKYANSKKTQDWNEEKQGAKMETTNNNKTISTSSELEKVQREIEKTQLIEIDLNKKEAIIKEEIEGKKKGAENLEIDKKIMGIKTLINQIKTSSLKERATFEDQIAGFKKKVVESEKGNVQRSKEIEKLLSEIETKKAEIAKIEKEVTAINEKTQNKKTKFLEINIDIETTKKAIKQKEIDIQVLNNLTSTKVKAEETKINVLENSKHKIK